MGVARGHRLDGGQGVSADLAIRPTRSSPRMKRSGLACSLVAACDCIVGEGSGLGHVSGPFGSIRGSSDLATVHGVAVNAGPVPGPDPGLPSKDMPTEARRFRPWPKPPSRTSGAVKFKLVLDDVPPVRDLGRLAAHSLSLPPRDTAGFSLEETGLLSLGRAPSERSSGRSWPASSPTGSSPPRSSSAVEPFHRCSSWSGFWPTADGFPFRSSLLSGVYGFVYAPDPLSDQLDLLRPHRATAIGTSVRSECGARLAGSWRESSLGSGCCGPRLRISPTRARMGVSSTQLAPPIPTSSIPILLEENPAVRDSFAAGAANWAAGKRRRFPPPTPGMWSWRTWRHEDPEISRRRGS